MKKCTCCLRTDFAKEEICFSFSNGTHLCAVCVDQLAKKTKDEAVSSNSPAAESSKNIMDILNRFVISQDAAKEAVSVAISQHISRVNNPGIKYKSNLLIYGPTGSGKTEIARALRNLPYPVIEFNCASLSPTGYIGESPSSLVEQLYYKANMDVSKTEKGIVFLDEFDKLVSSDGSHFSKKNVQQEFLKIIEGTEVTIRVDNGYKQIQISTENILFIAAGAFTDLENIANKKADRSISLSGSSKAEDSAVWQESVTQDHFIEYGLIPELVGRFPIISYVSKLTKSDYLKILTVAENSIINDLIKIAKVKKISLEFSTELLNSWADKATKMSTGARGLRGEIEKTTRGLFLNEETYAGKAIKIGLGGLQEKSEIEPLPALRLAA